MASYLAGSRGGFFSEGRVDYVLRVEGDGADRRSVSGVAGPAPWIGGLRCEVQVMPGSKNFVLLADMPLFWTDLENSAVQVLDVVPAHEFAGTVSGLIQIFESTLDILRSALGGSEC